MKTLEAINKSIEKWEKIVQGEGEDRGIDDCALCQLFWDNECVNCPIRNVTHEKNCHLTPYDEWLELQNELYYDHDQDATPINNLPNTLDEYQPKLIELAKKELQFLKAIKELYELGIFDNRETK